MNASYGFQLRKAVLKDFAEGTLICRKSRKLHSFYSVFCHLNTNEINGNILARLENFGSTTATVCSPGVTILKKGYCLGNCPGKSSMGKREESTCSCGFKILNKYSVITETWHYFTNGESEDKKYE